MLFLGFLIFTFAATLLLLLLICFKPYPYWKIRNVEYKPPWPIVGNFLSLITQTQSLVDLYNEIYNQYHGRYVGLYQFRAPSLLIRDPKLINELILENFETFPERSPFIARELDPVWNNGLFSLPATEHWKNMRKVCGAIFTSSKLKIMFSAIEELATSINNHIATKMQNGQATLVATDICGRFTNDIIAMVTLGVTCNSFQEQDNSIYLLAKEVSDFDGVQKSVKFFLGSISKKLARLFRVRFIKKTTAECMSNIIQHSLEVQSLGSGDQLNLINIMKKAGEGQLNFSFQVDEEPAGCSPVAQGSSAINVTQDDMISQSIVFFAGGFDTLSRAISFTIYELAVNPDVQERLWQEIVRIQEIHQDQIDYDILNRMRYLDMVVSEALRKWPPIAVVDRKALRNFKIWDEDNTNFVEIDEQTLCIVPVFSIHRDPTYYMDPEKFDPERFRPENKSSIPAEVYLPFGIGRRACIGKRFSIVVIKLVIFYILRSYEIAPVEETPIPIVLSKTNVNPVSNKPLVLGFRRRND